MLGGTVSAGAYTAGALDFLIEALDSWTQLRDANNSSRTSSQRRASSHHRDLGRRGLRRDCRPRSSVRIRSDRAQHPGRFRTDRQSLLRHLDQDADPGPVSRHQRYRQGGHLAARTAPQSMPARGISSNFPARGRKRRSWVAAPLRVILTLTNLRGVPFRLDFDGDAARAMSTTPIISATRWFIRTSRSRTSGRTNWFWALTGNACRRRAPGTNSASSRARRRPFRRAFRRAPWCGRPHSTAIASCCAPRPIRQRH